MANATGGGFKGTPANTEKGRFRMIRKGPDIYFLHAQGHRLTLSCCTSSLSNRPL